ncbi:hypothetical protein [Mesorhizobium sp.]
MAKMQAGEMVGGKTPLPQQRGDEQRPEPNLDWNEEERLAEWRDVMALD